MKQMIFKVFSAGTTPDGRSRSNLLFQCSPGYSGQRIAYPRNNLVAAGDVVPALQVKGIVIRYPDLALIVLPDHLLLGSVDGNALAALNSEAITGIICFIFSSG